MNQSIVITRYARALVKYVTETGDGAVVCSEAETLVKAIHSVPDLSRMVTASDDVVSPFDKKKLLQGALGNKMSSELSRFLTLLNRKGRMDLVEDILRDFIGLYYKSAGKRVVQLVVAVEPTERLLQRVRDLIKDKTGDDAIINVTVDPDIIGGFVLDFDDYLLDASARRALDRIKEQFIEQNRRII